MPLSNFALDKFVAPDLSKLTECNAIDMATHNDQQAQWVANFILNSILRAKVNQPYRAYTLMFLRRAEMSFVEHENGRIALQKYIKNRPDYITYYFQAVFHFETYAAQSYQALEIIRKWSSQDLFKKGDNSTFEHLNRIYNRSKHADKNIFADQLPQDATMPVWVANNGLKTEGTTLTFGEMADILVLLSDIADKLSNPEVSSEKGGQ